MDEMEASCSLKFRVGSACSYDRRDRSKLFEVVPLVSCNKDVQGHKSAWCFAGVENESELILARAGIFYMSAKDMNALTICPFHRSELGTGWRRRRQALVERYQKLYFREPASLNFWVQAWLS